ncbi:MAG TPA: Ppx/GppA phosphatase family protein [Candidatus Limnocylindria bacterium]|nr:Ppx/GppA phosphatase family protein [Candidatus Limnocylindria bacterium]
MRLGVLDVGSNTVHLLVVDAHVGAPPTPAHSVKSELRLAELLDSKGRIAASGIERLTTFVSDALAEAEDKGVEEVFGFATSAIRDAPNGEEVLARVREASGASLEVLSGEDEARITFLAARRWYGWSAGRLLVLDIGGGSLEVASGKDEEPDAAFSVPLGAGRLTRDFLTEDPPGADAVRALRKHVRTAFARDLGRVTRMGHVDRVVGTSKTFRSLARISGAAPSADGPYVRRTLKHADVRDWLPRLADLSEDERGDLPGVSCGRARQLVAGAVVADAVMDLLEVEELEICPWALREGVILRRLDQLAGQA